MKTGRSPVRTLKQSSVMLSSDNKDGASPFLSIVKQRRKLPIYNVIGLVSRGWFVHQGCRLHARSRF